MHTLLAVKGIYWEQIVESDDNHICNQMSVPGEAGANWTKFMFHKSGVKTCTGTAGKEKNKTEIGVCYLL